MSVKQKLNNKAVMHKTHMYNPMASAPIIEQLSDGSLVMDAVPLIANQDLLYYGFEIPPELFDEEVEWDTPFIGRLTQTCAEKMLDQFEGLALTNDHVWIEKGARKDHAVGTFLKDAELDGDKVRTRCVIYDATAIVRASSNENELSISGEAQWVANPNRGQEGEPDFFIEGVELNHVALVREGRAGPEARLLNHKATLDKKPETNIMAKIKINDTEYEVDKEVASDFDRLQNEVSKLANTVTTVTTERDTAQGALSAAQAQIKNGASGLEQKAAELAKSHAQFAHEAASLGYKESLELGKYEKAEIQRKILNEKGAKLDDKASSDLINGAWLFAVSSHSDSKQSVTDKVANSAEFDEYDYDPEAAIRSDYFGVKTNTKKEV